MYLTAVTIVLLAVVAVALLGTMREAAIAQDKLAALTRLILRPAKPTYVGRELPRALVSAMPDDVHRGDRPIVIAFLDTKCGGCRRLVRSIVHEGFTDQMDFYMFFTMGAAGHDLWKSASRVGACLEDSADEELFDAGEVRATPLLLSVRPGDLLVSDSSDGISADWLRRRLTTNVSRVEG